MERIRRRTARGSADDSGGRAVADRVEIIARVLQSLEYESAKKVEDDIIKRLQDRFGVPRALALPNAAQEFAARTSAEEFLGEVLRLLGPYVGMLRDIYRLLEQFRATESGTAEALRLDDRGMRKACRDIPISEAFLRRLRETYVGWMERELRALSWGALRDLVRWDARFYGKIADVPLLQTLTFAPALITRLREHSARAAETDTLQNQLAELGRQIDAIAQAAERPEPVSRPPEPAFGDRDPLALPALEVRGPVTPGRYTIPVDELAGFQPYARLTFTLAQARSGAPPVPASGVTQDVSSNDGTIGGLLFLRMLLEGRIERPWPEAGSRNAELRPLLDRALADPRWLHGLVVQLLEALSRAAPVVGTVREQALLTRVLEVIDLPFWKDRARLYEVWVLVRTARAIESSGVLRAVPRLDREGGTLVLRLPKNTARKPSFDVEVAGPSPRPACLLWFQRQTRDVRRRALPYEPDVRCTRATEPYRDLFLVECKDRAGLARQRGGEGFDEVARRYLERSDAELVWLVNYSGFWEPAAPVETSDRRVARFADHFHPGNTPPEFDEAIHACLAWRLAPLLTAHPAHVPSVSPSTAMTPPALAPAPAVARIELRWDAAPSDLDLHLWCETWSQVINFQHRGSLDRAPWAAISDDRMHGFGPEEIRVAQLAPVRYVVAVHNYSAERPLAGCAAEMRLELDGNPITVQISTQGDGRWWHVLELDGKNGVVSIINRIRQASPWGTT